MAALRRFVLSGCSGGGKSTLLGALGGRGYATIEEPGRLIVREELASDGDALPWVNSQAFAARAIEMSVLSFDAVSSQDGPVFFDRSFIDAISYIKHINGELTPAHHSLLNERRYAEPVFLTPPWPEIFETDVERQIGFKDAVAEFERLQKSYVEFGYQVIIIPKASVEERVTFLLEQIEK